MSKNKTEETSAADNAAFMISAAGAAAATEVAVPVTTAEAETPVRDATTQEAEQTVYVGPNVLPLALRRFQVFRGGLPPYVERAIEKIPEVRSLIVPVDKLDEARAKTEKAGTNEFRLYQAVKKAAEGVK